MAQITIEMREYLDKISRAIVEGEMHFMEYVETLDPNDFKPHKRLNPLEVKTMAFEIAARDGVSKGKVISFQKTIMDSEYQRGFVAGENSVEKKYEPVREKNSDLMLVKHELQEAYLKIEGHAQTIDKRDDEIKKLKRDRKNLIAIAIIIFLGYFIAGAKFTRKSRWRRLPEIIIF